MPHHCKWTARNGGARFSLPAPACGRIFPHRLMKILMVAADRMEFPGILRHATGVESVGVPVDWSRSARLGDYELVLVANGMGAQRAASAVDAALQGFPAEAIVSTGFCGALAEELQTADIVVGSAISVGSRTLPALHPASARTHHTGVVCSIDHVAQTAAEKAWLHAGGGSVVEMEAAGVAGASCLGSALAGAPVGIAVVTNIRLSHITGLELPRPGISAFHLTFSVALQ